MPDSAGPLDGLLVADFSRVLAGPFAAMTLGDLGADVVKVERPGGGDDTRAWGPPWHGRESTYYLGLNRNKRSVALDLADAGDRALARSLGERADVLIESFRPGLMASWGLGGDALRERNPRLVSCSITAFGSSERAAALPAYALLLQAMGGLMSVTGEADGPPLKVGAAVVDLVCGLLAVAAIEAALVERERTGAGRHVEVSLLDSVLTALLNQGSGWVSARAEPARRGNRHPSIAPYETYAAADRPFALAVGNDRLFGRLCEAIGRPELARDERFATNSARVAHLDALGEALEAVFRTRPAEHWVELLRATNVPVGPINRVSEAYALAESRALAPVQEVDGLPLARPPVGTLRHRPPRLDEHGDEIRAWLARPGGASGGRSRGGGASGLARGHRLADRLGQHEAHVLAQHLELRDVLRAARAEEGEEALHELLGRARAGRDADRALAREPLVADLGLVVDQVGLGPEVARDVDEALGVGGVLGADDQHEVAHRGHLLDRRLAIRRGVADVVRAGPGDARELLTQAVDDGARLVDGQRRLGDVRDALGIADLERVDVRLGLDEDDVLGRLAHRALDLLVARVADEDDRVALGGELLGLHVHLGHERAGGVEREEVARRGLGVDGGGDAVGGEDRGRALGDRVVELLDEDRPALAQPGHDVLVVDDLLAHVDRRAVELERALDGLHGAVDAGAVAARRGEQQPLGGGRGGDGHEASVGGRLSAAGCALGRWPDGADETSTAAGEGWARSAAAGSGVPLSCRGGEKCAWEAHFSPRGPHG